MKKLILFTFFSLSISADPLIVIRPGVDPNNYNTTQMKQRIWTLERAVAQLQKRIEVMEKERSNQRNASSNWICTYEAMGDVHTGLGGSKSVAKHNASTACQKSPNNFHCKFVKCEN